MTFISNGNVYLLKTNLILKWPPHFLSVIFKMPWPGGTTECKTNVASLSEKVGKANSSQSVSE